MKKIITILGNRPQFIKSATVSKELAKNKKFQEIIIHTGQHFDLAMSEMFFSELGLKKPKYFLNINNLNHGAMTGRMLEEIEKIIIQEKPKMVVVYGDTNSTLAGALAAAKANIPIAHIEAGLRSYNNQMAEEVNRIITDSISSLLFSPTKIATKNLVKEGIKKRGGEIIESGDVMYDSLLFFSKISEKKSKIVKKLKLKNFALCTIHRAENTDDKEKLRSIFSALKKISQRIDVVVPMHPRTKKFMHKYNIKGENLNIINPIGYLDMIALLKSAKIVLTDSGGLQKEAFFLQKPSVIPRDQTEWQELVNFGYAFLAGSEEKKIIEGFNKMVDIKVNKINLYGDGKASKIVTKRIISYIKNENNYR